MYTSFFINYCQVTSSIYWFSSGMSRQINENMGGNMQQKNQVIEWSNSIQYPIRLKYIFLLDGTR